MRRADKFDEFWEAYGFKVGKQHAIHAWDRLMKAGEDPDVIIAGAIRYRRWLATVPSTYGTKHPHGWLVGRRWEDELVPGRF